MNNDDSVGDDDISTARVTSVWLGSTQSESMMSAYEPLISTTWRVRFGCEAGRVTSQV